MINYNLFNYQALQNICLILVLLIERTDEAEDIMYNVLTSHFRLDRSGWSVNIIKLT